MLLKAGKAATTGAAERSSDLSSSEKQWTGDIQTTGKAETQKLPEHLWKHQITLAGEIWKRCQQRMLCVLTLMIS